MIFVVGSSGGGGSGPSASDAILTVTVPTGSTVTMTKGGTTLTPTMWVSADAQWEETALFVIPAADFDAVNPWTVVATINSTTTSATIIIDDNKEYELDLRTYDFVSSGVFNSAIAWNIDSYTQTDATIVQETGDVKFTTGGNNNAVFTTSYPCDLTKFSTLKLTITSGASYVNSGYVPVIAVGKNRIAMQGSGSSSITGIDAYTQLVSSTGNIPAGTYTLNIASLYGYYYVGLTLAGTTLITGTAGNVKATSFALE